MFKAIFFDDSEIIFAETSLRNALTYAQKMYWDYKALVKIL